MTVLHTSYQPSKQLRKAAACLLSSLARQERIEAESRAGLDTLPDTRDDCAPGEWDRIKELEATIGEALDERDAAQDPLIELIRKTSPDGPDPTISHRFVDADGRTFIALPDGVEVDRERARRHVIDRVIIFEPGEPVEIDLDTLAIRGQGKLFAVGDERIALR